MNSRKKKSQWLELSPRSRFRKRTRSASTSTLTGALPLGWRPSKPSGCGAGRRFRTTKSRRCKTATRRKRRTKVALRYLDYRPRSVDEIRRHLKSKDVEPEVMDEVVERLTSVGLLDDRAFARYWLENRSDFRPRGERALRLELRQKGVPGDIIAEVLSEGHNEDEAAYRAAMAQARKVRTTDPVEFRRKLEAHLARRGFSYDTAREAAARAWSELQPSEENEESGESEV